MTTADAKNIVCGYRLPQFSFWQLINYNLHAYSLNPIGAVLLGSIMFVKEATKWQQQAPKILSAAIFILTAN